jgi:protocatechuate 3,4-dioxygenase beta subunit
MVALVALGSALDRLTTWLAALACLVFCLGLLDVKLTRPRATRAPAESSAGRGSLVVSVVRQLVASGPGPREPAPVGEATVRVFHSHAQEYAMVGEDKTAQDGRVTLSGLPQGTLWVVAEAPGLGRSSAQLILVPSEPEVELVLAPAHRLAVRVEDDQGRALPQATVLVTGGDPLPFGALTGADGTAPFDRLGPGPWTVKAAAPGFESVTQSDVTRDLTLSLRSLGSLIVHVRAPGGEPRAEATVFIVGSQLWPARRAPTDSLGIARITGLLGGSYDLKASQGDLTSQVLLGYELNRGENAEVTLELARGRMISILVQEGGTSEHRPVAAADVVLSEGGLSSFPLRGRSGTDGRLILGPIAPGPAAVAARAAGFVPRAALAVPELLTDDLVVPLVRAATLKGQVVDLRDRPVEGASIEVVGTDLEGFPIAETPQLMAFSQTHFAWSLKGPTPLVPAGELGVMPGPVPPIPQPWESVHARAPEAEPLEPVPAASIGAWVTGLDGRFAAHPVTPGRIRALVRHPGYVATASESVSVAPGGEASVRVVLRPGGSLEGRVRDERGYPMDGVRVDVVALAGTLQKTTLTARDGSFAFGSLPSEVVIGLARPDDFTRFVVRRRLTIREGERTQVELALPAPRPEVRVVVCDGRGRPIAGAQVTLLSLDPDSALRKTLFTDSTGSIAVADARGLELLVTAEAAPLPRTTRTVARAPESIELVLEPGVMVTGRVTTVRGRHGVQGASVTVVFAGERRQATTDRDGIYRIPGIPPGPVQVVVTHSEFAAREIEAKVERTGREDRPLELPSVDLEAGGNVEGEVVDEQGRPVPGARVAVGVAPAYLPLGVAPSGMAMTDAGGRFRLNNLNPGNVDLSAVAGAVGRGSSRGVRIDSGRTTSRVRIQLGRSPDLEESTASGNLALTLSERAPGEVVVMQVPESSEPERAGIKVGDRVLTVDGERGDSLRRVRGLLSGPAGSDVVIEIERHGKRQSFRVTREAVRR